MVTAAALEHFWRACEEGGLEAVQAAAKSLVARDARKGDNYALRTACANGHLEVARWLARRFALTAADARAGDNAALHNACVKGHLRAAQWLQERFGLGAEDVRSCDNRALRHALANGREELVIWLVEAAGRDPEAGGYGREELEGMGLGEAWAQWAARKDPLVKSAAFGA